METARHSDDQPRFQAVPEAKVQARYDHAYRRIHRQQVTVGGGLEPVFSVECKCGDRSPWLSTAGLGHGWHARHRQEAVDAVT